MGGWVAGSVRKGAHVHIVEYGRGSVVYVTLGANQTACLQYQA